MTTSLRKRLAPRARPWALATALWAFGLCTSVILVGLWGRSVVTDPQTLEDATRAVLESGLVNDRVEDWLREGIVAAEQQSPGDVSDAIDDAFRSPRMQRALEDLVDRAVEAALAPPDSGAAVDLSGTVEEAVPVMAEVLEESGLGTEEEALRSAAVEASDLVLSSSDQGVVRAAANRAGGLLTRVVVVGLAGLVLTGAAAVALSEDRQRQLRSLMVKIAMSAFTFAVFLRVGAWAVDPRGGRSPVAAGASRVLASNIHVPALVGLAATALVVVSLLVRRRRRGADGGTVLGRDDEQLVGSTARR